MPPGKNLIFGKKYNAFPVNLTPLSRKTLFFKGGGGVEPSKSEEYLNLTFILDDDVGTAILRETG